MTETAESTLAEDYEHMREDNDRLEQEVTGLLDDLARAEETIDKSAAELESLQELSACVAEYGREYVEHIADAAILRGDVAAADLIRDNLGGGA